MHSGNQTPSLPDARPRYDRFRCGGRESKSLALALAVNSRLPYATLCLVALQLGGFSSESNLVTGSSPVTPTAERTATPILGAPDAAPPATSSAKLIDTGQIPTAAEIQKAVAIIVDPTSSRADAQLALVIMRRAREDAREYVPELARAMLRKDPETQSNACDAIRGIGLPPVKAVPDLIRVLQRKEPRSHARDAWRRDIAELLGCLGPDAEAAVPSLVAVINEPRDSLNSYASIACIEALSRIGLPAKDALPLLSDISERDVRTVKAIAQLKLAIKLDLKPGRDCPPEVTTQLIKQLDDPDVLARTMAAELLIINARRMQPHDQRRALNAFLAARYKRQSELLLSVSDTLDTLYYQQGDIGIDPLIELLDDEQPDTRRRVATTLGYYAVRAKRAVPKLIAGIKDPATDVAIACVQSLRGIDPASEPVFHALRAALEMKNEVVKAYALVALTYSGPQAADVLLPHLASPLSLQNNFGAPTANYIEGYFKNSGKSGVSAMRKVLGSEDTKMRLAAIRVLGNMQDEARGAADEIRRGLTDKQLDVRGTSAIALVKLRVIDQAVIDALSEGLTSALRPGYSGNTNKETFIHYLGEAGPAASSCLPQLEKLASDKADKHSVLHKCAAEAIERVRKPAK